MARIGIIGLGNMGGHMARNLVTAGHQVKGFDLSEEAMNFAGQSGVQAADSVKDAASEVDIVVSMLPVGANVREVMTNEGVFAGASPGTLIMDSSTIDVETAQQMHAMATEAGFEMLDAPVSGGTVGADNATLTFMCGGEASAFARGKPILEGMGKNIVHCGDLPIGALVQSKRLVRFEKRLLVLIENIQGKLAHQLFVFRC